MAEDTRPVLRRLLLKARLPGSVDKAVVEGWLREYWQGAQRACPICTHREWVIGDYLVQAINYPTEVPTAASGYPTVLVICNTCGHTLHFNAVIMGLVKRPGA